MCLFTTPWTVACQATLSMGILQARILEWVAISFWRRSAWPRFKPMSPALAGRSLLLSHLTSSLFINSLKLWETLRSKLLKTLVTLFSKWTVSLWKDRLHFWYWTWQNGVKTVLSRQSEWLWSKSLQAINAGEGVEKRESSYIVGGHANSYNHYGEQCGDSLKNWK